MTRFGPLPCTAAALLATMLVPACIALVFIAGTYGGKVEAALSNLFVALLGTDQTIVVRESAPPRAGVERSLPLDAYVFGAPAAEIVPDTATWATLTAGLGVSGAMLRHRPALGPGRRTRRRRLVARTSTLTP